MRKYVLFLICCCFLVTLPAHSMAASGLYGSVNAGGAWLADQDWSMNGAYLGKAEYDTGYSVGVAFGYMKDAFRVEGEIAYQTNDQDTFNNNPHPGDFDVITYLVNGYFDFDMGGAFTPYVTAGIGAATVNFSEPGFDEDDTVFAYQLGAGVGIAMSEALILDFRYRYLATQDAELDIYEAETASHNLTVGLRMNF
jgi:opacity protein-like surface antigen